MGKSDDCSYWPFATYDDTQNILHCSNLPLNAVQFLPLIGGVGVLLLIAVIVQCSILILCGYLVLRGRNQKHRCEGQPNASVFSV